jgi:hypothetical protein
MGRRGDYRWREPKKPKKTEKKTVTVTPIVPSSEVEVIPKGKAAKEARE